jgi:hypothetical protein
MTDAEQRAAAKKFAESWSGLTIGPKSYIDNGHWNEFKPRKRGKK